MYINKLDEIFDSILDYFNKFLMKNKIIEKIKKKSKLC